MRIPFPLIVTLAWVLLIAFALAVLAGCETRRVEFVRPDGSWAKYTRTTWMGESATEGVIVDKDGEAIRFEVGRTGSDTAIEAAVQAYGVGLEVGRREAQEAGE